MPVVCARAAAHMRRWFSLLIVESCFPSPVLVSPIGVLKEVKALIETPASHIRSSSTIRSARSPIGFTTNHAHHSVHNAAFFYLFSTKICQYKWCLCKQAKPNLLCERLSPLHQYVRRSCAMTHAINSVRHASVRPSTTVLTPVADVRRFAAA